MGVLITIAAPLALGIGGGTAPAQAPAPRATQSLSDLMSTLYPSGVPTPDCDDDEYRLKNPGACLTLARTSSSGTATSSTPKATKSRAPEPNPELCATDEAPPDCPPRDSAPASTSDVPDIEIDPTDRNTPESDSGKKGPGTPGGEEDCGTFDVICKIGRGINKWFTDLVVDAMKPVVNLITDTTLTTPDLTGNSDVAELHRVTRWVANSVFVLFVVAGGFVVASHETLQSRYTLRETLPRIVIGFIAVNASMALTGMAIGAINAVTMAVLGGDPDGATRSIKKELTEQLEQGGIFMILVALVVLVLAVLLLAIYVVRLALTIVVVVAGPLALVCHASPYSEGIAKMWWRALIGLLSIQLLQAITLIVFVKVFFVQGSDTGRGVLGVSGQLMNLIVAAVLLFILIKIPFRVLRQVNTAGNRSAIASVIKYSLVARGLPQVGITRHGSRGNPRGTGGGRDPRGRGGGRGRDRGGADDEGSGGGNRDRRSEGRRADGGRRRTGSDDRSTARRDAGGGSTRGARERSNAAAHRAREAARRAWEPLARSRGTVPRQTSAPMSAASGPSTPSAARLAPPLEATPAGAGKPVSTPADAQAVPRPTQATRRDSPRQNDAQRPASRPRTTTADSRRRRT